MTRHVQKVRDVSSKGISESSLSIFHGATRGVRLCPSDHTRGLMPKFWHVNTIVSYMTLTIPRRFHFVYRSGGSVGSQDGRCVPLSRRRLGRRNEPRIDNGKEKKIVGKPTRGHFMRKACSIDVGPVITSDSRPFNRASLLRM